MTTEAASNPLAEQDTFAFPVSFAQQRLWLLDRVNPQSCAYNLFFTVRISSQIDIRTLEQSIQAVVQRHEALRTIFAARDGQPVQMIVPAMKVPLLAADLEHLPGSQQERELLRLAQAEVRRPFDLAQGPLLRLALFRLGETEHMLLLTIHHIIFDGWSVHVFFRDLAALYQAFVDRSAASLPELPVQYADYTIWQREQAQGESLAEQLVYWKKHLAGAPDILELPTDRPRPAVPSGRGSLHFSTLSRPSSDALKTLSQQEGVSLFMTLVAAFQTLLHRYTRQDDLLLGTDIADRSQAGTEDLVGFFVNTIVLRCDLAGNPTFLELLGRARKVILEAYTHQDVPFEHLVKELQPDRSAGQNPFFQVMLSLDLLTPHLPPAWTLSTLKIDTGAAKFDLSLEILDHPDGLLCALEYNSDLFDEPSIARMMNHWQTLLQSIVSDPGQRIGNLPLLSEAEWHQQVVDWNTTEVDYPREQGFATLFAAQVARTPHHLAAVCQDEQLTYLQLHQQATCLASTLQHLGVEPESLIALLAERNLPFLTAVLAIWQAGGAYLPLDPHHPPARLRHLLGHSRTRLVLVTRACMPLLSTTLAELPDAANIQVLVLEDLLLSQKRAESLQPVPVTPHTLAYVIYTSGSTGLPKGVMIEQGGLLNHLYAKIHTLHLGPTDRVAQTASQCFDISVWQLLAILLTGGCVHILPDEVAHHPIHLLTRVEQQHLTILETVPSLLRAMLEAVESGQGDPPPLLHLRWLIPTGEALPPAFCQRWLRAYPHIPLLNAYGPTECSDDVTHFAITEAPPETQVHTPIGRPIQNLRLYILDAHLRPVPVGVSGELCVGGVGVGRGYLHDPQRTAEAFVPDPFSTEPGARLYKTGDLARYLPDGTIEFLGRLDHQVKLRGNRIELGEIEALLRQHPAVQDVVVVAREDAPNDKYLAAYVVASPGVAAHDLRHYLKDKLPDYMLPASFVLLEMLPLTPNGKVDRHALPVPERSRSGEEETYIAPVLPLHRQLIQIWEELLDVRPIGMRDNFFELGGHSLLAVRLLDAIEQTCGKKIPPSTLLAGATIEEIANVLQGQEESSSAPGVAQSAISRRPPPGPWLSSVRSLWTKRKAL